MSGTTTGTTSGTTTPAPATTLQAAPAVRKAAAQALGGKATPAVQGKRNSGSWQGKGAIAGAVAVARGTKGTSNPLASCQVAALVAMAAGTPHHNPRVVARLAAKGMCSPQGVLTPAGATIVAAVRKAQGGTPAK